MIIIDMDYKQIIEHHRSKNYKGVEALTAFDSLFISLRDANFTKENFTDESINDILSLINTHTDEVKRCKLNIWLLKYIEKCSNILTTKPKIVEKVTYLDDDISNLKPEDFKKKEWDWEFLKKCGIKDPLNPGGNDDE